ncbi:helix-turn-helix domain-containing protein [Sphingobacterium faecale]|uniref:Helix-turn-helix transcriptional regulator n=1 Tax=Sphingobacterium faecale TaxID=2803775 RepID=A0ABS1R285_9SPHI|nr:helix-turn-helix transcriptional regulator [Sphingobacterium faecale]MBL1408814.1 helix-turn-helix transcriptional regulator [Sphingobacterium faecale]
MIGEKIRELREVNNVLLRQLAAQLDIDTALLSKMERGDRPFRKEDLVKIASIFEVSDRELLTLWLADKVLRIVDNESYKKESLQLVLNSI